MNCLQQTNEIKTITKTKYRIRLHRYHIRNQDPETLLWIGIIRKEWSLFNIFTHNLIFQNIPIYIEKLLDYDNEKNQNNRNGKLQKPQV